MLLPKVAALYGALNAILNVALAANVTRIRRKNGVSIGEGASKELLLAIRIHANNAEFMPIAILMLLLAELMGGSSLWLHVAGGAILTGRIAHVIGMPLPAPNAPRFLGTALSWISIVAIAVWVLVLRSR